MPIDLHVIRTSDFVRVDSNEQLDFEESKRVLQELAHACRKRAVDRALFDIRDLPVPDKPHFTPAELAALVTTFREAGFTPHQRLAILYRQDVYGGVRNFTFFSRMRGLDVQAFHEFETAMQWLWKNTENPEEKHGTEVPIHRHDAKERTADLTRRMRRAAVPASLRRLKRAHR